MASPNKRSSLLDTQIELKSLSADQRSYGSIDQSPPLAPTPDEYDASTNSTDSQETKPQKTSTFSPGLFCAIFSTTIFGILTGLLVISHTVIGFTALVFNEQHCANESESDIDLEYIINGDFDQSDHHRYFRFSQLLYCFLSILHWAEYGYLFYGIFCFIYTTKQLRDAETGRKPTKTFWSIYSFTAMICSQESTRKKIQGPCSGAKKGIKTIINPILLIIFFVLFWGVSIAPPIINMVVSGELVKSANEPCHETCHETFLALKYSNEILTILAHAITVFVRLMMVLAAAMCGNIWLKKTDQKDTQQGTTFNDQSNNENPCYNWIKMCCYTRNQSKTNDYNPCFNCIKMCCYIGYKPNTSDDTWKKLKDELKNQTKAEEDRKAAEERYTKVMIDYEERKQQVKPIYKIFRSWFVFQWIHYIFKLSHDMVYLIRPWIWYDTIPQRDYSRFLARDLFICIFDILVILSSYLSALKMNAYLRRYIRDEQKKQVKQAIQTGSRAQYAYTQTGFRIPMIPRSDFVPKVPGFGLNISLQGPGFLISTVIVIIATVATFSKV